MKLDTKAAGLAFGLLWGAGVLIGTWCTMLFNFPSEWVSFLSSFYLGMELSIIGGIIGGLWGFLEGYIGGFLFAWLYNKFAS